MQNKLEMVSTQTHSKFLMGGGDDREVFDITKINDKND